MSAEIKIWEPDQYGDFHCECGNSVDAEGFIPCDANGTDMEPIDGIWGGHYRCDRCQAVGLYKPCAG